MSTTAIPTTRSKSQPPPPVIASRRKRGGQPGNTNAYQHGYYSVIKPHPHASLVELTPPKIKLTDTSPYYDPDRVISRLERFLTINASVAEILLQKMQAAISLREMLLLSRVSLKVARSSAKVMKEIYLIQKPKKDLLALAQDAPRLVQWEFAERGIREKSIYLPLDFEYTPKIASMGLSENRITIPSSTPLFVPQELIYLRTNLDESGLPVMESPFLTDQQWLLVRESLASLRKDQDFFRKYKRRKPRFSTRLLFEAVLIKLAFNLRWEDLPSFVNTYHPDLPSFPLRVCQRFYRDLCNSSRLQAMYKILHWHLHVYGEVTLTELVEQDTFQIGKKDVVLCPDRSINWRLFTALLLLQRAFHNQRTMEREREADRRLQGRYYRLPPQRVAETNRSSSSSAHPGKSFSYDRLVTQPASYEPLESNTSADKWQQIEKRESLIRAYTRSHCRKSTPPENAEPNLAPDSIPATVVERRIEPVEI